MEKCLTKLSLLGVLLLLGLLTGCGTFRGLPASETNEIKRSWVRRVSPVQLLNDNPVAQNFSPLVKENGSIVGASSYGGLLQVTKRGRVTWRQPVKEGVSGSGSLYKNFLFYGSLDKKLHCFNTSTAEKVWEVSLSEAPSSISEFHNGVIYTLTEDGGLYAIDASDGRTLWKIRNSSEKQLKVFGGARPLIYNDTVVASFPNGKLGAFSLKTGKEKWSKPLRVGQKYSDVDFLALSPQKNLFAGSFDEAVYKLNPSNGQVYWQAFEKPVSDFSFFGEDVFFSASDGKLISLKESAGAVNYKKDVFEGLGNAPLFVKGKLVVSDSKGALKVLNRKTGDLLSRYDFTSSSNTKFSTNKTNDKIYMMTNKGYLYSLGLR